MATLPLVALGAAVPAAQAGEPDDLKDKQKDVHAQVEQAQADVEDASKAITRAKAALVEAEQQLAAAQSDFAAKQAYAADALTQLQAAEAQNATMQAALQVAQANLTQAKADVVAGQAALDAQQVTVKDTVVETYEQGSPELLAWTGYLDSQTPADLIRKMEYADTLVEDQNSLFDQLHAAELALRARKDEVKAAEAAADEQADLAEQQLVNVQHLKAEADQAANDALLAQNQVTLTVAAREKAQHQAERAKAKDEAELAKLKKQEARIKQQIIAAAAADHSTGYVGAGRRLPDATGRWRRDLAVRLPDPPDLRLLGAARRHRLRRRLRRGHARRRRRQGDVALLLLGLRQPALPRRRQGQRPQPHRGLQPRDVVPRERRRHRHAR